jgi:hypothetical protein
VKELGKLNELLMKIRLKFDTQEVRNQSEKLSQESQKLKSYYV